MLNVLRDLLLVDQRRYKEMLQIKKNKLLLGVTGSIATGKSTVARIFEELGAPIIDFDILSRIVVEPGKPAWSEIVNLFGKEILNEDETINRKKLREIVFMNPEKKRALEEIQHPRIGEEFRKLVDTYAEQNPNAIIQVVVPLLIEAHMQSMFEHVVMVYAPESIQKARLMKRDGLSEELALKMIRSQLSPDVKKSFCDIVIDNSASLENTRRQVEAVWERLSKEHKTT
jgi:dephospho-CoA kinase